MCFRFLFAFKKGFSSRPGELSSGEKPWRKTGEIGRLRVEKRAICGVFVD